MRVCSRYWVLSSSVRVTVTMWNVRNKSVGLMYEECIMCACSVICEGCMMRACVMCEGCMMRACVMCEGCMICVCVMCEGCMMCV